MPVDIPLTNGYSTVIDEADVQVVSQYRWVSTDRGKYGCYATARIDRRIIYLHRFLLNAPADMNVDHIDHNGLNNCRANIRLATPSQNSANSRGTVAASGYRGVHGYGNGVVGKWRASIKFNYQRYVVNGFSSPVDAARAYDKMARELHGEFAIPNFPQPDVAA